MLAMVAGLVILLGVHSISIAAPAWRESMVQRLGPRAWKGLYSLASILGLALLVWGYRLARLEPVVLYEPPSWTRHAAAVLMLPVFPLLLATYFPGRIKAIVKHPMLAATMAWALAHLLANGTRADALLFGSFLAWALMDRISVERRVARPSPGSPSSALNDGIALVGGLAIYGLFVAGLHLRLFGTAPMP